LDFEAADSEAATEYEVSQMPKLEDDFQRRILDSLLEGCQVIDFDWRYLYLNPAAEKHNRRPRTELMGQRFQDMWPGIEATEVYRHIESALVGRQSSTIETEFTFPDGASGWFAVHVTPIPMGVFIMSLDISERIRIRAELESANEHLRQAQKLEAIGQLAGGVAHDFNNMLGVILGHVELGMDSANRGENVFEDFKQIRLAAERSADLTRQLLAFACKQVMIPQSVNVNHQVERFLSLLRRLIGEDVALSWLPGAGAFNTFLDPGQLEQILSNLVVNARDAIDGAGEVVIETASIQVDERYCLDHLWFEPGEFILISVSDNGHGMLPEVRDRIFEPFFTTKELGHGTGLGLATVYGIVKQNKGFVHVYSEPGDGTTFKVYLPRYKGEADLLEAADSRAGTILGGETILVVEDEPAILDVTRSGLERLGYHVLPATSAAEALKILDRYPGLIHLLITDVVMPVTSGPELAKLVQSRSPGTRVLYVSGYTPNMIVKRGVLQPDVNFLPKPFTRNQLGQKVREVFGSPGGEEPV
jgi:two-component system cell cycle sensor histidine kinase/response regulator CckA